MKKGCCKSILNALKQSQKKKLFGFTLVELLIAILIIGVLTAMALPMYQKSVDKSRYATLMPLAKNIKDAQEAFYLGGGKYSKDLGSLDVRVPGNPSGHTATLSDGTTVEISTTDGYGYVKLSKNNLNNNYIIYQDRSQNYPGEIHCEALTDSDRANELCQNLGGQKISGSLTSGYTTYILSGTGAGIVPDLNQEAENHGNWQSCDTYPCTKACDRTVKTGYECNGTYNEDHSYSETVCWGDECVTSEYDEEGHKTKKTICRNNSSWDNACLAQVETLYDDTGKVISERTCVWGYQSSAEHCSRWAENEYIYTDGKVTQVNSCGYQTDSRTGDCADYNELYSYEDTADGGSIVTWNSCPMGLSSCSSGSKTKTTYDKDGKMIALDIGSDLFKYVYDDAEGEFGAGEYSCRPDGDVCEYELYNVYEVDGNKNVLSKRPCAAKDSDGRCTAVSAWGYKYTYENGRLVSSQYCSYDADNNCSSQPNEVVIYMYDEDGNETSRRKCDGTDSDGNCTWWTVCYEGDRCMM